MLRAAAQGYYMTCTTGRDLTCCFIPNKDMIITFSVEKVASSKTGMQLVISCCWFLPSPAHLRLNLPPLNLEVKGRSGTKGADFEAPGST